jgi:hypothetical protein
MTISEKMLGLFTEACRANHEVGKKVGGIVTVLGRETHYNATTRAAVAEKALCSAIETLETDAELGRLVRRMSELTAVDYDADGNRSREVVRLVCFDETSWEIVDWRETAYAQNTPEAALKAALGESTCQE